jgi:hypothetical protein
LAGTVTPERGPTRQAEPDQTPAGTSRDDEHEVELGLFRSWRSLYVTVIVYTTALTVILYVLSRLLDFSG